MNHSTIEIGFYISLFLILPLGGIVLFIWGRRMVKPIAKGIEKDKHIHLHGIAFKTFIYMLPAVLVFVLFAVPVFYFGNLQKRETYCKELIKVNKLEKTDPILKERCTCLDINELFNSSRSGHE
jgi:hypothetical protein